MSVHPSASCQAAAGHLAGCGRTLMIRGGNVGNMIVVTYSREVTDLSAVCWKSANHHFCSSLKIAVTLLSHPHSPSLSLAVSPGVAPVAGRQDAGPGLPLHNSMLLRQRFSVVPCPLCYLPFSGNCCKHFTISLPTCVGRRSSSRCSAS